jgi:hypothetical protein
MTCSTSGIAGRRRQRQAAGGCDCVYRAGCTALREDGPYTLVEISEGHWQVWRNDTDRLVHEERGRFSCLECFQWCKNRIPKGGMMRKPKAGETQSPTGVND